MGLSTNEVVHYALETAAFGAVVWWMASTNTKFNAQIQDLREEVAKKDQKIKELDDTIRKLSAIVNAHSLYLKGMNGGNIQNLGYPPNHIPPQFHQSNVPTQQEIPIPNIQSFPPLFGFPFQSPPTNLFPMPSNEMMESARKVVIENIPSENNNQEKEVEEEVEEEPQIVEVAYNTEELDSLLSEELKDFNSTSNLPEEEDKKNAEST